MHWALQKQKGFTIVELLIVVVVIAILAAITIVAYNGISNRAKASAVASIAEQVHKKVAVYAATNSDQYPTTLAAAGIDAVTASNVQYSVNNSSSPAGFCITATQNGISSYLAKNYTYTTTTPQVADQPNPVTGVCPGHAPSGSTPATNVALNPGVRVNPNGWSAISSTGGLPSGGRATLVSGLSALGITTCYRNTLGGTPSSWWRVQYDADTAVTEGESYVLSGYLRSSVTASTGVIIIWENAAGATIIESPGTFASQTGGTWVRKSVVATAPVGAVSARFHFGATNAGASGAYFDATAIMFHPGTAVTANYADGASANWIWDGAVDASTSRGPAV